MGDVEILAGGKPQQVLIHITPQVISAQNLSILILNIWKQPKLEKNSQTMISLSNVMLR